MYIIYIYTYRHIHIYIYTYVYIYLCICVYMCKYIYKISSCAYVNVETPWVID